MSSFRHYSLLVLMLTTVAASAMSLAGSIMPADAAFFRHRDRASYTEKFASEFYVRGRCFITKGKYFLPIPKGVGFVRVPLPAAGQVKCLAKKRKRKRGIMIPPHGSVTINMRTYGPTVKGKQVVWHVLDKKSKTCGGKKRCDLIIMPKRKDSVSGFTACIEAKGKSRILQLGTVPRGLDKGFKAKKCAQRKF